MLSVALAKKHRVHKKDPLDYFPRETAYKSTFLDNENTVAPKYLPIGGLISVDNEAGLTADLRTYVDPKHLKDIKTTISTSDTRGDMFGNTYNVDKNWVSTLGPPF